MVRTDGIPTICCPPRKLVSAAAISEFVSRSWQGVYQTYLREESERGLLYVTTLHSPDGPKVFTLVHPDGRVEDVTR